jgi:hypothetical protein
MSAQQGAPFGHGVSVKGMAFSFGCSGAGAQRSLPPGTDGSADPCAERSSRGRASALPLAA